MIRIQLPPAEVERLEQTFRSADDRKRRDRLQIVLLAHRGRPHQDIVADLCINRRSVTQWRNAYLERRLDGLRPHKAQDRHPSLPPPLPLPAWRPQREGSGPQGHRRVKKKRRQWSVG
jgi:hypothetical protein